jgi:transcriptional regulator with XRE-family HTH domain
VNTDIGKVRRANLRRLVEQHRGPAAFAKRVGFKSGPSYVGQLLKGARPITEKTARKIEEELGLPEWSLDALPGEPPPFTGTDRTLIAAVIRALGDALEQSELKVGAAKFAELAALAYEHSHAGGRVDQAYIQNLIKLLS